MRINLYDINARTQTTHDSDFGKTSQELMYAIIIKTYNKKLFDYIVNLSIYDFNWYELHKLINYTNEGCGYDIEDVIYECDMQRIQAISQKFPDINYIMMCILSKYNENIFPYFEPDQDNLEFIVDYGPTLCNDLYLYKRWLLDKIPKLTLKLMLDKSNFEWYSFFN
jgi:hypothetical protein